MTTREAAKEAHKFLSTEYPGLYSMVLSSEKNFKGLLYALNFETCKRSPDFSSLPDSEKTEIMRSVVVG